MQALKKKRKLHLVNWIIYFDPHAAFMWWRATWRIWRCSNPQVSTMARGMFWRGFTYPFEVIRAHCQWRIYTARPWAFELETHEDLRTLRGYLRTWRIGWLRVQEYRAVSSCKT